MGLAKTLSFCSLFLMLNGANAADSSVAHEADAALNRKDYQTAFSKYTELAKEGSATAQFNLGVFYLKGQGTQKNEKQAYDWFKKSALGGHASAKKFIENAAARGNVYASAALKELQPTISAQTPNNTLPPKAETPIKQMAESMPLDAAAKPTSALAPAPDKDLGGKSNPDPQGISNEKSSNSDKQNFYVAIDLEKVSLKNLGPGGNSPSTSYSIAGGYKILNHVDAEVEYLKTGTGNYESAALNSLYVSSIQLSAVFNYPIFNDLDLLGKLGLASNTSGGNAVSTCNCNNSRTFLYGLGAQYKLTKHFGTRIQYTNYGNVTHGATNGDLTMSAFSLGLLYSF